jgi:predicted DNA-binding protein with PD1-like motif
MKYTEVKTGRVFLVKFEHGDDFLEEIKNISLKENIRFATITFMGALAEGETVVGPKARKIPAEPTYVSFDDAREIVGFGNISMRDGAPHIHAHASVGRGEMSMTACLRKACEVFITVEAVIAEMIGADIKREKDAATGLDLLTF